VRTATTILVTEEGRGGGLEISWPTRTRTQARAVSRPAAAFVRGGRNWGNREADLPEEE